MTQQDSEWTTVREPNGALVLKRGVAALSMDQVVANASQPADEPVILPALKNVGGHSPDAQTFDTQETLMALNELSPSQMQRGLVLLGAIAATGIAVAAGVMTLVYATGITEPDAANWFKPFIVSLGTTIVSGGLSTLGWNKVEEFRQERQQRDSRIELATRSPGRR